MTRLDALEHAIAKCMRDCPESSVIFLELADQLARIGDALEAVGCAKLHRQAEELRLTLRAAILDNPMSRIH